MKKLLAVAAVAFGLSGCAIYHDGYYDDGYKSRILMAALQGKLKGQLLMQQLNIEIGYDFAAAD